jgi:uncharacterized coiled-coil protein SlyX
MTQVMDNTEELSYNERAICATVKDQINGFEERMKSWEQRLNIVEQRGSEVDENTLQLLRHQHEEHEEDMNHADKKLAYLHMKCKENSNSSYSRNIQNDYSMPWLTRLGLICILALIGSYVIVA